MTDSTQSPIEDRLHRAARSLEPGRPFSEGLWNQIAALPEPAPRRSALRSFFARPAWAVAGVALVITLVVAAMGPQKVAAAFGSLLGYLPGIGFVDEDGGALYLAGPTRVEQDGVTLTVDQAVSDGQSTTIAYHIDGAGPACFYDGNQLRLPDGKTLLPIGGGVSDSQARVIFAALPDGVSQADLLVSQNMPSPDCTAPAQWTVPLAFGSKPGDVAVLPVIENPPAAPETAPAPSGAPASDARHGIGLALDRLVELEDGYLVVGHVTWQDPAWQNVRLDFEHYQILDANGQVVPAQPSDEGSQDNLFAFQTTGKDFQPPFTLQVSAMDVWSRMKEGPSFSFDAGDAPKVGQTWALDAELDAAGQPIRLRSATAIHDPQISADPQQVDGYAFEFETSQDVSIVDLAYAGEQPINGSGSSARLPGDGTGSLEITYPDGAPTGPVSYRVSFLAFRLPGDWQIEWQMP